jgi:hypothetical protein
MELEEVYERKNSQYKVVAKVKHETRDGYVYLIAHRDFGSDKVTYYETELEFSNAFTKTNTWLA